MHCCIALKMASHPLALVAFSGGLQLYSWPKIANSHQKD